ncbi:SBP domain [Castilleja foliolosa]|uniref:SBP domain n=1 Tax=Castilleja foliolosa TaxID=1961234 RepID=A0ABD3BMQ4_9LAMI
MVEEVPAKKRGNMQSIAKKRGLPFHSSSIGHQDPSKNWNLKSWEWDSSRFVATPAQQSDEVRPGNPSRTDQSREGDKNAQLSKDGLNLMEETQSVPRPNKRVRSGSPGGTSRHPMCQVDECEEDLLKAKDYHRRHKVCEVHSKAVKASVGRQMQRFCQQCSRFHPLLEFDEGKRSCRRRLAGHNRRRRKTQPEETTRPRVLLPDSPQNNFNCDVNVILEALAHVQGSTGDNSGKHSTTPPEKENDNLIQLLSKINSLPLPGHLASTHPLPKTTSSTISNHAQSEKNQNQTSEKALTRSTMDFLAVLSATPSCGETQSQPSIEPSNSEKSKSTAHVDQITSYHSPVEETDTSPSLHLQLLSSLPEDNSARKLLFGGNDVSSNGSNPSEERSTPFSSPLVHNLFPMKTSRETTVKDALLSNSEDEIECVKSRMNNECNTSLQLFGGLIDSIQSSPYQAGYTSSSGSDHSSNLNSDSQERTDRIRFKLFDKDPSDLPLSLRNQIYNWLSSSPSEMESYIKPGCIVLSLYLSMSSLAWNKLEENFLSHVKSLVYDTNDGFWRNGRFLVYTDRKMASHKDGSIRLCKYSRDWTTPELISVSPVAIVAGQETSLLLKGRNLTAPNTTIHCTHADGYSIEKVSSSCHASGHDEISLSSFKIREAASNTFGRCFIEVENRFKGTVFPVIIADNTICQELRLLEYEINGANDQETLYFLNELGWLFQRKSNSSLFQTPNYNLYRFKLLLTFSIEHDFCALVKTLLDILLELVLGSKKGLANESLAMLSEIHLLNRAVRRRCRAMVDLLVNYSVINPDDSSRRFIFLPDLAGAGNLTPLHLAACMSSSDDIVDALTNDPQTIGMQSWKTVPDANGLSPYAYASMRNNHSYNDLIARKVSDRKNGQISISIKDGMKPLQVEIEDDLGPKPSSCSKCAVAAARLYSTRFSTGLLHRPYIHSMLVVAVVCVCVCLLLRGHPNTPFNSPLVWENMRFGSQ